MNDIARRNSKLELSHGHLHMEELLNLPCANPLHFSKQTRKPGALLKQEVPHSLVGGRACRPLQYIRFARFCAHGHERQGSGIRYRAANFACRTTLSGRIYRWAVGRKRLKIKARMCCHSCRNKFSRGGRLISPTPSDPSSVQYFGQSGQACWCGSLWRWAFEG